MTPLLPSSLPPDPWPLVKTWLVEQALPLWATRGFDMTRGSFIERLHPDGTPDQNAPRRLIVQARQIYVYARAHRHGWIAGAGDIAQRATDAMIRDYFETNGQDGWSFSVDAQGRTVDQRRNLYTQAFALFALGMAHAMTGDKNYLAYADRTLAFLDAHMAAPAGGYVSNLPDTDKKLLQNPHMHLLESLLALHEQDSARGYIDRAKAMVSLFETRLFQPSHILSEYFDDRWRPLAGERGHIFEPGHHYEWIWLLDRFDSMTGSDTMHLRQALRATAEKWRTSPGGFLWGEVTDEGHVVDATSRNWPYTEAIKAALTHPEGLNTAQHWLSFLYAHYLKPAFPGGWIDKIDGATGRAETQPIPASSFYHIMCALSEHADKRKKDK